MSLRTSSQAEGHGVRPRGWCEREEGCGTKAGHLTLKERVTHPDKRDENGGNKCPTPSIVQGPSPRAWIPFTDPARTRALVRLLPVEGLRTGLGRPPLLSRRGRDPFSLLSPPRSKAPRREPERNLEVRIPSSLPQLGDARGTRLRPQISPCISITCAFFGYLQREPLDALFLQAGAPGQQRTSPGASGLQPK